MIKDRIVRVKLKKFFHEHRPWSYVGKVTAFNDSWVVMDARGIMLSRQQPNGVQVDAKPNAMMVPTANIESIRILPDDFDYTAAQLTFTTDGQKLMLQVSNAADAYVGELGEG